MAWLGWPLRAVDLRGSPVDSQNLLFKQASATSQLSQLGGFVRGLAGLVAGVDVCLAEPFRDGAFVDAKVLGGLGDRGVLVPAQCDADDVIAGLLRVGLWHGVYPSRLA